MKTRTKRKGHESTENKDFRLLLAMTVLTALAGVIYVATQNFVGPNYERPTDLYFTYFDSKIYANDDACFAFKVEPPSTKSMHLTVLLDNETKITKMISAPYAGGECIQSALGVHSITVNADNLSLMFKYEKMNNTINVRSDYSAVDVFSLENIRKVNVSLHNGAAKNSVYLIDFSYQSEYVELAPYETKVVQKIQPVYDTALFAMGKEFAVKGGGGGINGVELIIGLLLMILPGFILFYDKTAEGMTKAVMFSFASFALVTLVANQFFSITRETLIVLSILLIGASIAWKKK
ncbi:hypothetical protein H0N95_02405 [Candidatus Micrarchaeota archaeon]|nr:hypothetical protein [Candidatus Micrarchaeota archaeon]